MKYTHLIQWHDDEYTTKATADRQTAEQLLQDGFEYVLTTPDNYMIFRKRK